LYERLKYNPSAELYAERMSDQIVLVTRKGQVTIPASKRKKYGIREGMRVIVKDGGDGIVIKPIIPIEEMAGVDADKIGLEQMRKKLDDIRARDRY
jgi:AbrB family looped-hinge helix DNA binding protein